ncbi:MAG: sigma-70 family RNA polymerase sigma factor [Gammaproteobacteria bacterium]
MHRAADHDRRAFEQIMRRHNQRLFRYAVSLMGEPSEAEDVLQESYLRAYRGLSGFDGVASFGNWLARIVRNEAIDRLRARAKRNAAFTLESDLSCGDERHQPSIGGRVASDTEDSNPEVACARGDMQRSLGQAIAALPGHFRTVFMLREVRGLSVKETAACLGIAVATVKTRDYRARLLLRQTLGAAAASTPAVDICLRPAHGK